MIWTLWMLNRQGDNFWIKSSDGPFWVRNLNDLNIVLEMDHASRQYLLGKSKKKLKSRWKVEEKSWRKSQIKAPSEKFKLVSLQWRFLTLGGSRVQRRRPGTDQSGYEKVRLADFSKIQDLQRFLKTKSDHRPKNSLCIVVREQDSNWIKERSSLGKCACPSSSLTVPVVLAGQPLWISLQTGDSGDFVAESEESSHYIQLN